MAPARRSHCPMAVPPRGSTPDTACFATSLVRASATTRLPSEGKMGTAFSVPAITAKATPSLITSTAAAVAARACSILVRGDLIDPEQSMMMISAPPELVVVAARPVSGDVTVMMASTSSPPAGRYSFWEISTVKSLIGRFLLGVGWDGRRGSSARSGRERKRGQDHGHVVHTAGVDGELDQRLRGAERIGQRLRQRQLRQLG